MSASRPKLAKPMPKPRPFTVDKPEPAKIATPEASSSKSKGKSKAGAASSGRGAALTAARAISVNTSAGASSSGRSRATLPTGKGKGRAAEIETVESTGEEDEDDDDFEEVPMPTTPAARSNATAGPSSPYPGTPTTPGTNLTAATTPGGGTTAGDTDADPYGDDEDDEDSGEDGDGVIRLEIGGETPEEKAKRIALATRKKPMTSKDRALRIEIHKLHVLALLASAKIRNRWATNTLLKARLLSLLPHPLVTAFAIPPSRFPDRAQRARLFVDALQSLVLWWTQTFFDISDSTTGQRTRPWDEVQEIVDKLPRLTRQDFLPGGPLLSSGAPDKRSKDKDKEKAEEERLERYGEGAGGERLRTVNSLMKKALQQEGSRDVSAILFVALCRACGLGTRLVVSLQAVPWRSEKVVVKKMSGAGKGGRSVASRQGQGPGEEDEDSMEEVPIPGDDDDEDENENGEGGPGEVMEKIKNKRIRGAGRRRQQDPAEVYRLRKPKPVVQTTGSKPKVKAKLDLSNQPPVFWAEVFSRPDQKWFPVDPTRGTVRKRGHFEPQTDNGPVRLTYVVAFEEDGHARDVTLRYTKSFGAKTAKLRVPQRKDEPDWWEVVLGFLARPYRLNRDDLEDAELENSQISEAMPVHMSGFKDHPLFVLERHLKREEVIQPRREVGKFRGEPVYRRANVLSCKTAENWMRVGRKVKDRQEPMKWVKQRAMTLNKRREVELARQAGEEQMQGLYAEGQTEIYRPPPIKNGMIPQNAFGNIDLYAPTMLPAGATHLPYKGIAKVAKQLEVSYAEACTGFEFKKQRAIPVITGIVVASEQAAAVMDAYEASTAAAEERERQKRIEKALKRWGKLINALRVRERLRATYGDKDGLHDQSHNPLAEADGAQTAAPKGKGKKSAASVLAQANQEATTAWAEKVVDRTPSPTPPPPSASDDVERRDFALTAAANGIKVEAVDDEDDEADFEEVDIAVPAKDVDEDEEMEEVPVDQELKAAMRESTPPDDIKDRSVQSVSSLVRAARTGTGARVGANAHDPSRTRQNGRQKVDNPYEDSDSDGAQPPSSRAVKDREEQDEGEAGANVPHGTKNGEPEDAALAPYEQRNGSDSPPPQPSTTTTRFGRTVKLRIGRIKEEPEETKTPQTIQRVTRSSKRKR